MLPDTAAGEALNSINTTLQDLAKKEAKTKTMFPGCRNQNQGMCDYYLQPRLQKVVKEKHHGVSLHVFLGLRCQ